jgi:hypothetical protein
MYSPMEPTLAKDTTRPMRSAGADGLDLDVNRGAPTPGAIEPGRGLALTVSKPWARR